MTAPSPDRVGLAFLFIVVAAVALMMLMKCGAG